MLKTKFPNASFIYTILWLIISLSFLSFIYHLRWLISFITNKNLFVVPNNEVPVIWFTTQICSNIIFLWVGFLLLTLFKNYFRTGFFDDNSTKVFNKIILFCITLALIGVAHTISKNIIELHFNDWNSIFGIANLLFRSGTKLLVFNEPQTMYFLLAIILWCVKEFVTKALFIKSENESFV